MNQAPVPARWPHWLPLALAALAAAPMAAAQADPAVPAQAPAESAAWAATAAPLAEPQATGLRRWIAALSPGVGKLLTLADRPPGAMPDSAPQGDAKPQAVAVAATATPVAPGRIEVVDLPVLTPSPAPAAAALPPAQAVATEAAAPASTALAAAAPPAGQTLASLAVPQSVALAPSAPAPSAASPAALLVAAAPVKTPAPPAVAEPRFDLAINNAPAAQVFLQLANGTAYNMLVSPDVSGTLSITLKDTTVPEAMDTMREMFGFEYRITGNRIFVYPNTVQTRLYRVNYLPGRRQGASDTRITSSAITASAGSGGGGSSNNNNGNGGGNGSGNGAGTSNMPSRADDNAHVRTTNDTDFWREVQQSLTTLVGSHGGRSVVLNPGAGVVVVKATPAELRQVENYLKAVQLSIERQVMLEAKIVEVSLSKDSQTGINWAGFGKLGNGLASIGSAAPGTRLGVAGTLSSSDGNSLAPGIDLAAGALGRGFYGLAFQAANFAALLNFLQTQGEVQVLSSPRIATLNNQKAVLKVGSDELYVTGVSTSTTSNGSNSTSSPTLTLQPFFSGISLDVTPQIDDAGNVMLHVHPTISTVSEKNKNIDLGSLGAFRLPLAASTVNETDSIVRVRDGQIVAIGGLMKTELHDDRTGMPGLSDLPGVGGLFRQTAKLQSKRELVIMIKPTVIHEDGAWPDAPSFGAPQSRLPLPDRATDAATPLARR